MNHAEVRDHLKSGGEMEGLVLTEDGLVLARGKVRLNGTTLIATVPGKGATLQLNHRGDRVDLPLARAVGVARGEPVEIQFGPKWQ